MDFELLSESNTKLKKGESSGYWSLILNLAPGTSAEIQIDPNDLSKGYFDLCQFKSEMCYQFCIARTGHARINVNVIKAQIRRTKFLYADREGFLNALRRDIHRAIKKASKLGVKLCIRLNGTSDLYWLAKQMAREFPEIQFYDYTALPKPWLRVGANYHLTFSLKEDNLPAALEALEHGMNVAVVFDTERVPMPATWRGIEVLNGDESDLRFLDGYQGKIIGLKFKDTSLKTEDKASDRQTALGFIQATA